MPLNTTSIRFLNGDSTISLGSLIQGLTTLLEKFFLIPNLNLLWFSLRPFNLILLQVAWENRPTPASPKLSRKQQVCVLFLRSKIFIKWQGDHFSEKVFGQVSVQLVRHDLLLGEPSNTDCNYRPVTAKQEDDEG